MLFFAVSSQLLHIGEKISFKLGKFLIFPPGIHGENPKISYQNYVRRE